MAACADLVVFKNLRITSKRSARRGIDMWQPQLFVVTGYQSLICSQVLYSLSNDGKRELSNKKKEYWTHQRNGDIGLDNHHSAKWWA